MKSSILLVLFIFLANITYSNVINVPADQSSIQAGIDAATAGDTILVAEGNYLENINYKGKAITVASHFILDQDTSHISKTIIDGSEPDDADYASVVFLNSGEDTTSILCGFTITGGKGTLFTAPGVSAIDGAGIYCEYSGAKIIHNYIRHNSVYSTAYAGAGGISVGPMHGNSSWAVIANNRIEYNSSSGKNWVLGGALLVCSNARVLNNVISHNEALNWGREAPALASAVIHFISDDTTSIVRSDVVFTGNTITHNKVKSTMFGTHGAGVHAVGSKILIKDNIIMYNSGEGPLVSLGGGIDLVRVGTGSKVIDNEICFNQLTGGNAKGGGMRLLDSEVEVSNNIIRNNSAGKGAGIYVFKYSRDKIFNNVIEDNYASDWGGGIYVDKSRPVIDANLISNNEAVFSGGGISCYYNSNPVITNNLIVYNKAGNDGGAMDVFSESNPVLLNNTICYDTAGYGGGISFNGNSNPTIINTIIYGNQAIEAGKQIFFWDNASNPDFKYCDIEEGVVGFAFDVGLYTFNGEYENNIDEDPVFSDQHFSLHQTSPCIDAGNPDTTILTPLDYYKNNRLFDGNDDKVRIVDIGAAEFIITSIGNEHTIMNRNYFLFQNYPNPFNPKTTISYKLPKFSHVALSIYNLLGQKVASLVSKKQLPGEHQIEWDASGFASGVYIYKILTDRSFTQTKKMILLR